MPVRVYTVAEANRALDEVRARLPVLRDAIHGYRFAAEQLVDLERMEGEGIHDRDHPAHRELSGLQAQAEAAKLRAQKILDELTNLGVEVKDPVLGLVDFFAERKGDLVYLCWQEGEAQVSHWHTLEGGFAARRPVSEF
ncbi:MAG TPA: DUF2203 domain-containing protein [Candidatus Thermoplasmatota archaeon]|nr:DUF2203 domain-containing protein [Candidatus Thermoplasmatota archaeon]